jgi:2-amino-4-hydroxy-6-hydroxymethyldihydropteridine diphosphokinase
MNVDFIFLPLMEKLQRAYLLLGGNLGDRLALQDRAVVRLVAEVGRLISRSSLCESEPWGFDNAPTFLNQVVVLDTLLEAREVLEAIQRIEKELGRIRHLDGKYHSRCIDIDILFYDDMVCSDDALEIPHPRLHLRQFTMSPLQEVAPDYVHPTLNKTVTELLHDCPDKSVVNRLANAV